MGERYRSEDSSRQRPVPEAEKQRCGVLRGRIRGAPAGGQSGLVDRGPPRDPKCTHSNPLSDSERLPFNALLFPEKPLHLPYLISIGRPIALRRSSASSILLKRKQRLGVGKCPARAKTGQSQPGLSLQKLYFSMSTHCDFLQDRNTF